MKEKVDPEATTDAYFQQSGENNSRTMALKTQAAWGYPTI